MVLNVRRRKLDTEEIRSRFSEIRCGVVGLMAGWERGGWRRTVRLREHGEQGTLLLH